MLFYDLAYDLFGYEDYGKSILWVSKFLLKIIFLWPIKRNKIISALSALIIQISAIISGIGLTFYVKNNYQQISRVAQGMCYLIFSLMAFIKVSLLWYKMDELEELIDEIDKKFWSYNIVTIETTKKIEKIYKYCVIIMLLIITIGWGYVFGVVIIPFFGNEKLTPFPYELPGIEWQKSPTYEIIYLANVVTLFCGVFQSCAGGDFITLGVCQSTACQYILLIKCFEVFNTKEMYEINKKINLECSSNLDVKKEYFIKCVKHHDLLLKFTDKINKVFNPIELMQLLVNALGICCGIFIVSRPDTPTVSYIFSIIFIYGFIAQLGIDCVIGTRLNDQATKLPQAIFHSNWKIMDDLSLKKDFIFVLQHSQIYPQLNAYKLYDLNMISFVKVIKMGFSVFTVLKSLAK